MVHGKVVKQFLPDASQKARATIRGKVRINVKVHVDESGRVTAAAFDQSLLDKVRDDDAARQEFVDLLEVLGPEDPRTATYRKALTARLF